MLHRQGCVPVRKIDERFLSVTLDYACLLGAPWWEGTRRTKHSFGDVPATPVDLQNQALRSYARMLAPAYLRLGGSESDRVFYAFGDRLTGGARDDARAPGYRSELTVERWDELCEFA